MDQATQSKILDQLNCYYATGDSTLAGSDRVHRATTYSDTAYLTEDRVIFGRNEPGLQHFHSTLAAQIDDL
ncbi:MAG: hypothetical protein HYX63_10485 [Gammaproteobacteria bacterium]|nr:hypothetical protein [Gammaproteobacteria bacterium]